MRAFKHMDQVRLVKDMTGEFPKSLIRRRGIVLGKLGMEDGHRLYLVKMRNRVEPLKCFDDEIELIREPIPF